MMHASSFVYAAALAAARLVEPAGMITIRRERHYPIAGGSRPESGREPKPSRYLPHGSSREAERRRRKLAVPRAA